MTSVASNAAPRILAASQDIACASTPFGLHARLLQDSEMLDLIGTSSGFNVIDEYRPPSGNEQPPYTRTFRSNLLQAGLAGGQFLRAVNVDLDGDGRDEIVAAYRMADGSLKLATYHRTSTPAATLGDTWSLASSFTDISLAAGDFDGSTDDKQELGVLVRTTAGALHVYVLGGDSNGNIAAADNAYAGHWTRSGPFGKASLATGDLLLDGRDQLAVVSESGAGATHALDYDLLEFEPSTSVLPIVAGDTQIGSKNFHSVLGISFLADSGGAPLETVLALEADAGDVVDSAAAELVVHLQFEASSYDYIGMRLLHFTTTFDAAHVITGIELFSRGPGHEFDSGILVQGQNENGRASFEATIAPVDRKPLSEIVVARSEPGGRLLVSAYKAALDRNTAFTYTASSTNVQFTNASTGDEISRTWNFGDGSAPVTDMSPVHAYALPGTYTVILKNHYDSDTAHDLTYQVQIVLAAGSGSSGGLAASYSYHIVTPAAYQAHYDATDSNDLSYVNIAAGDMDRDGIADIVTIARDSSGTLLRSRWNLADPADPSTFSGTHVLESQAAFNGLTALDIVASDFDGDSLHASIGNDCRQVTEPQMRQVVWLPPFFKALQTSTWKQASWGQSSTNTTSVENRSGSYTSHDVAGYVGVEVGTPDSLPFTVEASVKFTAGHNWQSGHGAIHGTESTLELDEGQSQTSGEALAIYEENSFNCYTYDVRRYSAGLDAGSGMRMCEQIDGSRFLSAGDAQTWDTQIPAESAQATGHPPAQWFPLQRDWASLALFHPVSSNAVFDAGHDSASATDGLFSSEVRESQASFQPYLQIDLGSVRDIADIRVFPAAGESRYLAGFRVFASAAPMSGSALPAGAGVTMFAPETEDDATYDRWNIWTRNAANPEQMLRARYIRLQHPGTATLRLSQVQVFGDVHAEPPAYPQAVCDPTSDDGTFDAMVWNPLASAFAQIEVRGDLLWNGSGEWVVPAGSGAVPNCTNHGDVPQREIWSAVRIGASGTNTWQLSTTDASIVGNTTSFDSSTRVGAEFDFKTGFIAAVIAGASYEFTNGITKDTENSSYWGAGLQAAGEVAGFDAASATLVSACSYNARPYAYHLTDRSDTGFQHDIYTVDYVVKEGPSLWKRANVPSACSGDRIFADGFE